MRYSKFLLLTIMAVFFVTGCNKGPSYRIGISQCSDDDWRQKMNSEVLRELMFYPEVVAEIRSADDSNEKQIADIRYFIDNGFDLIIAAPNEARAITSVIREAYEKEIPVVLVDRGINDDCYTTWLRADNEGIGKMAAEYVRQTAGDDATVVEIRGLAGSTPADGRHVGFEKVFPRIVGSGYGDWNYDRARAVADSLLRLFPEADVVYAHNDRMALAASDVADSLGLDPYIIGIDGAPGIGIKAVAEGKIDATFIYPTEGHNLVRIAMTILRGDSVDKIYTYQASSAIDETNVDIIELQNLALDDEIVKMQLLKTEIDDYWQQHNSQRTLLYAIIAIVVLLCLTLFMVLKAYHQRHRHHRELLEQNRLLEEQRDRLKQLMEQLDAATNSKLAFFTNVSHDLRTPLTLIAEPVEQLAHADNLTPSQHKLITIADKNVRILKRLINQVLDFRKYDSGKLSLSLTEVDLKALLTDWAHSFDALARRRDIKFVTKIDDGDYVMAIDVEKIERVFYNLVSNAFKYTADNGRITVECRTDGQEVELTVSDTGKGISADDLPFIFERFYRADRVNPEGTGLGLPLAKAFAELHGGDIAVESQLGKGTTFRVTIPVSHVDSVVETHVERRLSSDAVERELASTASEDVAPDSDDKPTILVIDDNADFLMMLKELLSTDFNVTIAPSGAEGIKKAVKYTPDLVICDVMMPEMDGMECCRRLKNEVSTSHIPVLMLTAGVLDEQRAGGYEVGADGYLTKPFNSSVLLSRVKNLIENRKRIRAYSGEREEAPIIASKSNSSVQSVAPSIGTPDIDNEFYKKFLSLVAERMSDPDLNIDLLASSLGLGRSQFYRKIKSLTNYSPVELLRRIRLTKARKLLTTTEMTVSEISYAVGFSTPAYFTKCYRETFGETPSELREKLGLKS